MRSKSECTWSPDIGSAQGPLYMAISEAIATHVRDGRLRAGDRLPPHRDLANRLGVDVTTVTRAYADARRRGLVDSCVGRGTFIRPSATIEDIAAKGRHPLIDMTMNRPPVPPGDLVAGLLRAEMNALLAPERVGSLLDYGPVNGSLADRTAGAMWLKRRLGRVAADRVMVSPGVQSALASVLTTLTTLGDIICCPVLTYPGLRTLSTRLGIKLMGLPMDGDGILPDAFEAACLVNSIKALYCCPTLANPTAATMSVGRRRDLAAVARHYGVAIVEDDAYGMLPRHAPSAIAALAPEITYYIGGLSKVLAPGLRVAYLVAPDASATDRCATNLGAFSVMTPPLMAALASRWIMGGAAEEILNAIRSETKARHALVSAHLPAELVLTHPEAFHLWLSLPQTLTATEFAERSAALGVSIVASEAFAVSQAPPAAVRVSLGGPDDRVQLENALKILAGLLVEQPRLTIQAA